MTMKEFLSDISSRLLVDIFITAALSVFLLLSGLDTGAVIIIIVFAMLFFLISSGCHFYKESKQIKKMQDTFNHLDQKYLLFECLTKPKNNYEKYLFDLGKRAGKAMIEEVGRNREAAIEYREYVENWAHEIKAPMTTLQLIEKNHPSENSDKVLSEMAKIDEQVERTLYYARLGEIEKDISVSVCSLKTIVHKSIGKLKTLFIQSHMQIEIMDIDQLVFTDEKWFSFMMEQLYYNAIKYTGDHPILTICSKQQGDICMLTVRDNGIGISDQDIGRIFERGFTGCNGRTHGDATGMGLYLVKKVAETLNIEVSVDSKVGKYTSFTMAIPRKKSYETVR